MAIVRKKLKGVRGMFFLKDFTKEQKEKCRFIEDDELPMLVLTLDKYAPMKKHKDRKWESIMHQSGGISCHHHYLQAWKLNPQPKIEANIFRLNNYWERHGCCSLGGVPMDEILTYRHQLQTWFGVDCNWSYRNFEEGLYPIDITDENLKKMCTNEIPKNHSDMIFSYGKTVVPIIGLFNLYILGNNSRR